MTPERAVMRRQRSQARSGKKGSTKMISTTLSVIILIEVLFTLFIAWGLMHEERFIAFEDRIIAKIKKRIARKKATANLCKVETA